MKRTIITTILLTLVAVSCHNELAPEIDPVEEMVDITVEAVVNDEDASTRTSLGGSNADSFREVLWDKGDEIAFFADGASSFSRFVNLNEKDAQPTAVFAGSVQESEDYAAFYPYSSVKSLGAGRVYFTLPATQIYSADDFAANMSPMVGRLSGGRLSFKNLCGIFVLNLIGEGKVSSITFSGYDASGNLIPVSGDASVNYTYSSTPSMNMEDAEGYSVTLDCGSGVSLNLDEPTPFHIVLPPGEYQSFALTIGMTDGRVMKQKGTKLMLVERSLRTRSAALTFVESEVINLSKSGTANCYIISKSGDYRFKAVKGNSSESVGTVASVKVLWESFGTSVTPTVGDLIETVNYDDGYVMFSTPSSFKEGNAVVAAMDSSGEILWSWHIWLTDQPSEQEYNNNAGTMMDRNLGATSATPGDVGALGLLYQWGRKDPFLGSSSITSTYGNTVWAKSTGTWPSAVSSSLNRGTIDYVTKNPMTFVTYNTSNYDWYYTGTKSTDDSRWGQEKTIYDPCPDGWRVPDGGTNSIWKVAGFTHTVYDDSNEGIRLNISNSSVTWYPACGSIGDGSGTLDSVGYGAKCWSVTPLKNYAYAFAYNDNGYVYPSDNYGRSGGYSVRCYKEDSGNPMIPAGPSAGNATDLASDGETANSYIVSESGTYKFKPVKGNSSTSVGTVSSVEVLWESFGTSVTPSVGDLIEAVNYDAGYVVFSTPSSFKEGNAVIAAKNSSGEILWSWHIWLTDQPQGQVYYNGAGTMMDRNLGATSATPGGVGALGLLYQWGRKDPFLGSSNISDEVDAKSTVSWPSTVTSSSSKGTIDYAVKNPMTFITYNSSNFDWYYTGSSSTDNTRWQSAKTIYDPCPVGWRVPDGGLEGVWSKALGSSSNYTATYDSNKEGINFSGEFGSASTIWYPASGFRSRVDGSLFYVDIYGFYWSVAPDGYNACRLRFYYDGYVYPSDDDGSRACGQSVRCLQE